MKFRSETAKKIASFIRKNPKAKPKDVAQTLGVKVAYVYNIKDRLKKGRTQVKEAQATAKDPDAYKFFSRLGFPRVLL